MPQLIQKVTLVTLRIGMLLQELQSVEELLYLSIERELEFSDLVNYINGEKR